MLRRDPKYGKDGDFSPCQDVFDRVQIIPTKAMFWANRDNNKMEKRGAWGACGASEAILLILSAIVANDHIINFARIILLISIFM